MQAMVYTEYGPPHVLQLKEVEKPVPKEDELLIKVHAASVNSWDWDLLRGKPFLVRLDGLRKPKYKILGCDVAGRVEAVGSNVTQFQPGDAVFGDLSGCSWGAFAEYVCATENALTLKPAGMTFAQAAAIPQAAVLALQGLRNKRAIQPGQKVLINGAGGGVGTFAVQLAKAFGAQVTAVDSTQKLEMLGTLGADHVIDYTQADFTQNGQRYDLILDVVAKRSIFDTKRALTPDGIFVMVGGATAAIFQVATLGTWFSMTGSQKLGILMHQPNKDLAFVKDLFAASKVVPVIDRCYSLFEVPQALQYLGEGHARGKVVITVEHTNKT